MHIPLGTADGPDIREPDQLPLQGIGLGRYFERPMFFIARRLATWALRGV